MLKKEISKKRFEIVDYLLTEFSCHENGKKKQRIEEILHQVEKDTQWHFDENHFKELLEEMEFQKSLDYITPFFKRKNNKKNKHFGRLVLALKKCLVIQLKFQRKYKELIEMVAKEHIENKKILVPLFCKPFSLFLMEENRIIQENLKLTIQLLDKIKNKLPTNKQEIKNVSVNHLIDMEKKKRSRKRRRRTFNFLNQEIPTKLRKLENQRVGIGCEVSNIVQHNTIDSYPKNMPPRIENSSNKKYFNTTN